MRRTAAATLTAVIFALAPPAVAADALTADPAQPRTVASEVVAQDGGDDDSGNAGLWGLLGLLGLLGLIPRRKQQTTDTTTHRTRAGGAM